VKTRYRFLLALLAISALPSLAIAQDGALTVSRNLQQLTDRAAHIVRGNVASAHVELHPTFKGLHTVVVRLAVRETLKGPAGRVFTFRQYVWDMRGRSGQTIYRKGDDLLLLMIEPSEYDLSSPAGMGQGMFRIERDAAGRELAVNGHANARLFDGIQPVLEQKGTVLSPASRRLVDTHRQGPIEAARLTALIREIVNAGR
jgi:hypothetical protein